MARVDGLLCGWAWGSTAKDRNELRLGNGKNEYRKVDIEYCIV